MAFFQIPTNTDEEALYYAQNLGRKKQVKIYKIAEKCSHPLSLEEVKEILGK